MLRQVPAGLVGVGVLLVLSACGDDDGSGSIVGSWTVDTIGRVEVVSNPVITLSVADDGALSGYTGCNNLMGRVVVAGNDISLDGPLATTRRACLDEPSAEQENAYLGALEAMRSFSVDGDMLTLFDSDGAEALTATAAAPLEGSAWSASRVNNGRGGLQSLIAGTEITAEFGVDGTVSGSSGCNTYSGTYEIEGDEMRIGPISVTEMACASPEGVMEQEQQYLAALGRVATWRSDGATLELRDAEGASQAAFGPVTPDT